MIFHPPYANFHTQISAASSPNPLSHHLVGEPVTNFTITGFRLCRAALRVAQDTIVWSRVSNPFQAAGLQSPVLERGPVKGVQVFQRFGFIHERFTCGGFICKCSPSITGSFRFPA